MLVPYVGGSDNPPPGKARRLRTTLLLTTIVTAIVLACGAGLVSMIGPAEAAFPGANGKIAFAYGDIYTMNPNGTDLDNLTRNNRLEQAPVWSPDGKKIAFTKFLKGYHIWVMNSDGSAKTRLAKITGMDAHSLTWSPSGKKIAFSRDGDIWIMNADHSNQRRFTDDPRFEAGPAWAPDGTRIAFWRSRDGGAAPDIWVKKLDGSRTIRLTTDPQGLASDSAPDWSPDGKRIAFFSNRHGDL